MIKKVSKVENLRGLLSFKNEISFSKKKNIIYAPNGLGKTNFSRLFKTVSLPISKEREFYLESLKSQEIKNQPSKKITFIIDDFDDQVFNENNQVTKIKVFNSDFIEENIRSNNFEKEITGKLEIPLGVTQNKLVELEKKEKELSEEGSKIKSFFEEEFSKEKEKIKKWDKGAKADGLHFRELSYEKIEDTIYSQYKSEEGLYEKAEIKFKEIKNLNPDKDKITSTNIEVDSEVDFSWVQSVLCEPVVFTESASGELRKHIEKLTNNWIEEGLHFCKEVDDKKCPFCREDFNQNSLDIIKKYKEHIESEKAKFEDKITLSINNISKLINSLEKISNEGKETFDKRVSDLGLNENWNTIKVSSLISMLDTMKNNLNTKMLEHSKIFTEYLKCQDTQENCGLIELIQEEINQINKAISLNKKSIEKVNEKLNDIQKRQAELRVFIGKSLLISIYERNKEKIDRRDALRKELQDLKEEILLEKSQLPDADLIENIKKVFNCLLHDKIGITKYSAEVSGRMLSLALNSKSISKETYRMSEGEKNIVALCYFLASSLEELKSSEDFAKSTFVIDDPICSVSYGYFYSIANLMKNFSKYISDLCWSTAVIQGQPQLILLTHNLQFLNLISAHTFKNCDPRKDEITYLELEKNENHYFRKIQKVENMSEFHTALRRVKGFKEGKFIENIGNDVRRILETICSFRGKNFSEESLKKIFKEEEIIPELYIFANDKSHSDWNEHEDPNKDNYKKVAINLITLLEPEFSELLSALPSYET